MAKSKNLWSHLGAVVLAIVIIGGIMMMRQGRKEVDRAVLFVNPIEPTPTFAPEAFPTFPQDDVEEATEESGLSIIMTPQPTSPKIKEEAPEVNERLEEVIAEQEQEYQNEKQANMVLVKTARELLSLWEEKKEDLWAVEREYGRDGLLREIEREIQEDPAKKAQYTPEVILKMQGLDFGKIKSFMELTGRPDLQQPAQYIGDSGKRLIKLIEKQDGFIDQDADFYFSSKKLSELNPELEKLLDEIEKVSTKLEKKYR